MKLLEVTDADFEYNQRENKFSPKPNQDKWPEINGGWSATVAKAENIAFNGVFIKRNGKHIAKAMRQQMEENYIDGFPSLAFHILCRGKESVNGKRFIVRHAGLAKTYTVELSPSGNYCSLGRQYVDAGYWINCDEVEVIEELP